MPSATVLEIDPIVVGARASKLSIKQIEEVVDAITYHHPSLCFCCKVCKTTGDKDLKTSLRDLEKSNFFTYEIDQWLLEKKCRIAIHSAKDLPEPIPPGLEIVAITAPLEKEDVIVFHPTINTENLPRNLKIATSSHNRKENVEAQIHQSQVVDLRGSIDQRIRQVIDKRVDGAVIAKVALTRLGYKDLNILKLKGETAHLQGAIAILARKGDLEMKEIFKAIDYRREQKSLYFGLDPSKYRTQGEVDHYPLIEIAPHPMERFEGFCLQMEEATHLLLTSQTSVNLLFEIMNKLHIPKSLLDRTAIFSVGRSTAEALQKRGAYCSYIAQNESQEGLIELFKRMKWKKNSHMLYLKSAKARPLIREYLERSNTSFEAVDLYDTRACLRVPKPNLDLYQEVVFTSPSGVRSFFESFGAIPSHLRVVCKGEVTKSFFLIQVGLKLSTNSVS